MTVPLLRTEFRWSCPNCDRTLVTRARPTLIPQHPCRGLNGLYAPFTEDGTPCKVVAIETEDYVAGEMVQTDGEGRPVVAIVTTRDDGQDVAVLAPCANAQEGK